MRAEVGRVRSGQAAASAAIIALPERQP